MKALILLAVVAAYVYASCPIANYTRAYIYAKGQAKVEVNSTQVTKGLRIELVSNSPWNPEKTTVLATANANDFGYYVIAGLGGCYPNETYGLRLFADSAGANPLAISPNETNHEQIILQTVEGDKPGGYRIVFVNVQDIEGVIP